MPNDFSHSAASDEPTVGHPTEPNTVSGMPTGAMPTMDTHQHDGECCGGASATEKVKAVAKEKADEVAAQAKATADQLKAEAALKADELKMRARSAGHQLVEQKKTRMTTELGALGDALNRASSKLHEQQHESIAQYTDLAAAKVDDIRQTIESKDLDDLIDDVQGFVRRQPALVFGGLFVAGVLAARFLKASSADRTRREVERRAADQSGELHRRTVTPQQAVAVGGADRFPPSMYNQKS